MRSPSCRTAPLALILVLFFAHSATEAAPLDPAAIPGDTKWLLHFDMEKARNWELMQKWQSEMQDKAWYRDKVEEMVEKYGWNPAEDLMGLSMYDSEYARHNGVLALHVRNIDTEKIASQFKKEHPDAKTEKYRNYFISTWNDSSPYRGEHAVSGCLASDSLMLIANDVEKIQKTLDVLDGESTALSDSSALLDTFNQEAILACRAIDVPKGYQEQTRCPVLARCRTATMFFNVNDNLMQLKYDLEANNEELASKMKGAVSGMHAMMGMQVGKNPQAKQMLEAATIERDGNHLLIAWQADSEKFAEVMKSMKKMKGWSGKKWSSKKWKRGKEGSADEKADEKNDDWIKNFKL
ncbi:MAG: hypothetical protein P8K78_10170 [Pirellulales bacterium]|nr:hypothetical protein [Pirellulales bacterium]